MRVVMTGASGFIGSALSAALTARGDDVVALRRGAGPGTWDPEAGTIDRAVLEGTDAVVHLAGESIGGRWTATKKARILKSRVEGTRLIAQAVADVGVPVLASGSAIGYYGDRGDEVLTEEAPRGSGFLADVVEAWEQATGPAVDAGVRTAVLRTALVLDARGGSFPRMLLPFRLGLGGRIGSGRQFWSWITLVDEVRAIEHILDGDLSGPVNLSAPNPVRNRDFARELATVLRRPAVLPAPAFALKLLLGSEFAREVLLASQRVVPAKLESSGFEFQHPGCSEAFAAIF